MRRCRFFSIRPPQAVHLVCNRAGLHGIGATRASPGVPPRGGNETLARAQANPPAPRRRPLPPGPLLNPTEPADKEGNMPTSPIAICSLCGLRFASRPLLELHIREDHRRPEPRERQPGQAPGGLAGHRRNLRHGEGFARPRRRAESARGRRTAPSSAAGMRPGSRTSPAEKKSTAPAGRLRRRSTPTALRLDARQPRSYARMQIEPLRRLLPDYDLRVAHGVRPAPDVYCTRRKGTPAACVNAGVPRR